MATPAIIHFVVLLIPVEVGAGAGAGGFQSGFNMDDFAQAFNGFGGQGGFDMGDIFSDFFASQTGAPRARRGRDISRTTGRR